MDIGQEFYVARFRELSISLKGVPAVTSRARSIEEGRLLDEAGELFLSATKRGYLDSLPGARELSEEYDSALDAFASGQLVGFVEGRKVTFAKPPQARRVPCSLNLFLDIAGNDQIEVFNDNGTIVPLGPLPPSGLLPTALPELFKASPFLLLETDDDDEAQDFARLAKRNTADRYSLACRLLAEIVATRPPAPLLDGPVPGNKWRHSGHVSESTLQPAAWKMVSFLWTTDGRSSTFDELLAPVYGDPEHIADANAFGALRRAANEFFAVENIPLRVALKKNSVRIESE
jgi:hypothetical protein